MEKAQCLRQQALLVWGIWHIHRHLLVEFPKLWVLLKKVKWRLPDSPGITKLAGEKKSQGKTFIGTTIWL